MRRARYIVVLGPDGCGKTTVADRLTEALGATLTVARRDFSFGILPPISRVLGRAPRQGAPEGQAGAGMVRPLGRGRALLLAAWYGVDHLLGHMALRRGPDVVISARAYHDFLYQRAYLRLPRALPRLMLGLGPRPDLIVTPLRSPQEIHDGKPELTVEEIASQYARIRRRLAGFRTYAEVDASGGVEDTVARIRDLVKL